jgi:uncharacterized short protein YbdD (DUF466 family)
MSMRSAQAAGQDHLKKLRTLAPAIYMKHFAAKLWLGIREWCGDNAYERYVQAQKTKPETSCLLTPTEFYVERVNHRYSRPNRCC